MLLNRFVNLFDEGAGLADEQDFFVFVLVQPSDQPLDLLFERRDIFRGRVKRMEHGMAMGEPSQCFAGIAEHDTAGPKAIDDIFGELRRS